MNVWTLIRTHIDVVTIGRIGLSQSAWGQVSQYILIPITGFPLLVSFSNPLALEALDVYPVTAFTLKRCVFISLLTQSLFFRLLLNYDFPSPCQLILQQSAEKEDTSVKKSKGCIQSGFFSSRSLQLLKRCFSLIFRSASLQKINYHPALALHFLRFREKPILPRISSFPPLFKCYWKYKTCNNSTQLNLQYNYKIERMY